MNFSLPLPQKRGLFLILVLGGLAAFWRTCSSVLSPFLVGFFVAYLLRPHICRLDKMKVPRIVSALLFSAILYVLLAVSILYIVPAIRDFIAFLVTNAPIYNERMQKVAEPLLDKFWKYKGSNDLFQRILNNFGSEAFSSATYIVGIILKNGLAIAGFFLATIFVPVVCFYVLYDWELLFERFRALMPCWLMPSLDELFKDIDALFSQYFRGQLVVCCILSIFYSLGFLIIGVKFWLLFGILLGMISFVPYGNIIIGTLVGLVSWIVTEDRSIFFKIIIVTFTGYFIDFLITTPHFIGKKTGIHALTTFLVISLGASLWGITGIFLSMPLAMLVSAFWTFLKRRYVTSTLYR